MPNKNQQFRLRILDQCLQNTGSQYTVTRLCEMVNESLQEQDPRRSVSKRTIYNDLNFIEHIDGYNIPIRKKRVGRYCYYRYENPKDSIYNSMISSEEKNILLSAVKTLLTINGLPQEKWIEHIGQVLRDDNYLNFNSKIIGLEQNVDLVGIQYIEPLYQAIMNEMVLKIHYCDFKNMNYDFTVHPYYLKQYNKRWYLICFNETRGEKYWLLALDRIRSIIELPQKIYNKNYNQDWDDFFYDIIGVTLYQGKTPVEVKLKVNNNRSPYVLTKPLHPTQKVNKYDDHIVVRIQVIPNLELISLILSYGNDIEVLSPEHVRQEVVEHLKNLNEIYAVQKS